MAKFILGMLVGALLASVIIWRWMKSRLRRHYHQQFLQRVSAYCALPKKTMDEMDAFETEHEIRYFLFRRSRMFMVRAPVWTDKYICSDYQDEVFVAWIRKIHAYGCRIEITEVSNQDAEKDKEQTDQRIEQLYKTRFNTAHKAMTGSGYIEERARGQT